MFLNGAKQLNRQMWNQRKLVWVPDMQRRKRERRVARAMRIRNAHSQAEIAKFENFDDVF